MISEKVLQALIVTAEVCGANLSEAAAEIMLHDLSDYPEQSVLAALADCRKTLTGRFTLAAIISRIAAQDGRPGAEEAWAMIPMNEDESIAWTQEMRLAWGVAQPLIDQGDKVGARMAFKEAYTRKVDEARAAGEPAQWEVSLGLDPNGRASALDKAVRAGYIGKDHAQRLLPHHNDDPGPVGALLTSGDARPLLSTQTNPEDRKAALENLKKLKELLSGDPAIKTMEKNQ